MRGISLVLGAAFLLTSVAAFAGPLAYEGFDYPISGGLSGKTGGFGFAAGWVDGAGTGTVGTGLTYPELPIEGNGLYATTFTPDVGNYRLLESPRDGQTTWFSFLYNRPMSNFIGWSGFTIGSGAVSLGGGAVTGQNGLFIGQLGPAGTISTTAQGNYNRGYNSGNGSTRDTTYLVVVQLAYTTSNSGTISTWVNPPVGTSPGNPGSTVAFSLASLDRIGFATNRELFLDEFRMAATYQDVVPEPSVAALLGGGAMLWCGGVRRRGRWKGAGAGVAERG